MSSFLKRYLKGLKPEADRRVAVRKLKVGLASVEDNSDQKELRRARRLSRLFVDVKSNLYGGGSRWRVHRENTSSFTCFVKLARQLNEYEQQYKIKVNELDFIKCQFEYWKENTYPSRLISESAVSAYKAYQYNSQQLVFCPDVKVQTQLDEEQVRYLARVRNERREDVVLAFRRAEQFTKAFLRRWS